MKAATSKTKTKPTGKTAEDTILWPFLDFAEQGADALLGYMKHCGMPVDALSADDPKTPHDLILAHYQLPNGTFDFDMAGRDLARWPAIAARINEIRAEQSFADELNAKVDTQKISSKKLKLGRAH